MLFPRCFCLLSPFRTKPGQRQLAEQLIVERFHTDCIQTTVKLYSVYVNLVLNIILKRVGFNFHFNYICILVHLMIGKWIGYHLKLVLYIIFCVIFIINYYFTSKLFTKLALQGKQPGLHDQLRKSVKSAQFDGV